MMFVIVEMFVCANLHENTLHNNSNKTKWCSLSLSLTQWVSCGCCWFSISWVVRAGILPWCQCSTCRCLESPPLACCHQEAAVEDQRRACTWRWGQGTARHNHSSQKLGLVETFPTFRCTHGAQQRGISVSHRCLCPPDSTAYTGRIDSPV